MVAFADGIMDGLRLSVLVENYGQASATTTGEYRDLFGYGRVVVLHEWAVSWAATCLARSAATLATPRSNRDILADFRIERADLRVRTLESRAQSHLGAVVRDCIRWNLVLVVDAEATARGTDWYLCWHGHFEYVAATVVLSAIGPQWPRVDLLARVLVRDRCRI